MTIRDALQYASEQLSAVPSPYLDSIVLLGRALGTAKETLLASMPDPCPKDGYARFCSYIEKRKSGVPVAYITGIKEFWGMEFIVGPGVLIPRPDTEILVESAVGCTPGGSGYRGKILDLCTGTGCVACAIAQELPSASITASDLDDRALAYAQKNILKYAPGISLVKSDLFDEIDDKFDLIVTNPPYIADTEYDSLEKDVRNEPRSALTSGTDGLDCIRRIIQDSVERILPNGYLCIEAARHQASVIAELLIEAGFDGITHKKDLAGRTRVTIGRRRER